MSEVHERLIAELLSGKVSLSAREWAAKNEIEALRAKLEKPKKPAKRDAEVAE